MQRDNSLDNLYLILGLMISAIVIICLISWIIQQ